MIKYGNYLFYPKLDSESFLNPGNVLYLTSNGVVGPDEILLTGTRQAPSQSNAQPQAAAGAPQNGGTGDSTGSLIGRTVADVEQDLILDTLQHCLGNRTHAANILGISIRTLRNKLRAYSEKGIPVPMPGGESLQRPPLA